MTLDQWMTREGLTLKNLAAQADIGITTAHMLRRGKRMPSQKIAERLRKLSHGSVTANDFFHADPAPATAPAE